MATHGKIDSFNPSQESWTSYAERLSHYFDANDITTESKKKSILLTICGPATYKLIKSLILPNKTYKQIIEVLGTHYNPKPSPIIQRYKFHTREHRSGESIAAYVAELRAIGEHCGFGGMLNEMIRDRIVCGVNDHIIQRRLLQEPELTYKQSYDSTVAMETATKDIQDLRCSTSSVQFVQEQKKGSQCYRCGGKNHTSNACRFRNAECRACGKRGHIARVCMSKKFQRKPDQVQVQGQVQPQRPPKVHALETVSTPSVLDVGNNPNQPRPDAYTLFTLQSKVQPLMVTVMVNKKNIPMEVDTGAALSLISEETFNSHFNFTELQPTDVQLRTYSGELISALGSLDVEVEYESQTASVPLIVVKGTGPNLLGRNWMSIIRLNWSNIYQVMTNPSVECAK